MHTYAYMHSGVSPPSPSRPARSYPTCHKHLTTLEENAGLSPGAIIPNVVVGAVAEAGVMQVLFHTHVCVCV